MMFWNGKFVQNFCFSEFLIDLNNFLLLYLILLVRFLILMVIFGNVSIHKELKTVEFWWTFIPGLILVVLGVSSIIMVYFSEESVEPTLTLKSIGHQWYWSYIYPHFNKEIDSFLQISLPRLLSVDSRIVLPFGEDIRFVSTSEDVLHRWCIPRVGFKIDSNPGRLNSFCSAINFPGKYFGQCSEICGANHSFIPISLEVVSPSLFLKWLNS